MGSYVTNNLHLSQELKGFLQLKTRDPKEGVNVSNATSEISSDFRLSQYLANVSPLICSGDHGQAKEERYYP